MKLLTLATALLATLAAACNSTQDQLEAVARDWCLTIRASQVIPVYPLTEDLQPGDVFLVNLPQSEQHELYEDRGFLGLDHMLTRLGNIKYADMYAPAYWKGTFGENLPHDRPMWELGPDTDGDGIKDPKQRNAVLAPRAAFPSYTFKVRKGTSFGAALPLQGIPVALSFMQSSSANGSVTIADAYTYAAPPVALSTAVREWAGEPEQKSYLKQIARAAQNGKSGEDTKDRAYVRVVQRVYLTGGVVVSVTNTSTRGGGVSAGDGEARELSLLEAQDSNTLKNYQDTSKAVSDALKSSENSGGSIQFVEASERSVSLKENFDRPLVIGYLGLDFEIDTNGELLGPISTFNLLEDRDSSARLVGNSFKPMASDELAVLRESIADWVTGRPDRSQAVRALLIEMCGYAIDPGKSVTLELRKISDGDCIQSLMSALQIPRISSAVRDIRNRIELWLINHPTKESQVETFLKDRCGVEGATTGIALRELTEQACLQDLVAHFQIPATQ